MSSTILRRAAGAILAATAALTITACGNSASDDADTASAPTLPSVQSEEEANASADAAAESEAAAAAEAEASAASEPATNDRGNIVKALGEEGGITNPAGDQLLTFAVDSIAVDPACTSDWQEYGEPVEEGHHLAAVQLRVSTSPAVSDTDYLNVSSYNFKFIGPDGITVDSLDGMATYGCLEEGQEFTSDTLGPGQMYTGAVVLDLPAASGTLIFDPSWGQTGGWEYSF